MRLSLLYVAAFIGAGFASGAEIQAFFVEHGRAGLFGILVSTIILAGGSGLVLSKAMEVSAVSYSDFLYKIGGGSGPVLDGLYSLFSVVGLGVMLAGCESLVWASFGLRGGGLVTASLVGLLVYRGADTVLSFGQILTPFMVLSLAVPSALSAARGVTIPEGGVSTGIASAVLYASYNLCFSIGVWATFHRRLKSNSQVWSAAVFGNTVVGALLLTASAGLWSRDTAAASWEIPMLGLVSESVPAFTPVFRCTLYTSMLTTALAHCYAMVERLVQQTTLNSITASAVVLGLGLLVAAVGFGSLVRLAYPVIGLMGLALLFLVAGRRSV